MKKRTLYIIFLLIAISSNINAQSKAEKQVALTVEALIKAMLDGDRTALTNIAAEELSYGHSSGVIDNKAEFVEKIASGKSDFVKIDLQDQSIKVAGKTAIVRHKLFGDTSDNGKPGSLKLYVLLIFQKQNGGWKLLARQAAKIL
jgi:ketosteroid isomerase-like protein